MESEQSFGARRFESSPFRWRTNMTSLIWLTIVPVTAWIAFCAVLIVWYRFFEMKNDHSGDLGLAVMLFPFFPFIFAYDAIKGILFGHK